MHAATHEPNGGQGLRPQAGAGPDVVTKGAFAAMMGVSPGRVSQWISEGKLDGDALVGVGQRAGIDVAIAKRQLNARLHLGQMAGNGVGTRLSADPTPSPAPAIPLADQDRPFRETGSGSGDRGPGAGGLGFGTPPSAGRGEDAAAQAIRAERLRQMRRANEREEAEDLARRGLYTLTEDARAGMTRLAASMLNVFEGAVPEFASAIAAEFKLSQRDTIHVLRRVFREVRVRAAATAAKDAANIAHLIEPDGDDDGGAEPEG